MTKCRLLPSTRPRASDDDDLSDHEEEFYYTELEVTVDTMTQTFADMYTSSPPSNSFLPAATAALSPPTVNHAVASLPDHDYQKKVQAILDVLFRQFYLGPP